MNTVLQLLMNRAPLLIKRNVSFPSDCIYRCIMAFHSSSCKNLRVMICLRLNFTSQSTNVQPCGDEFLSSLVAEYNVSLLKDTAH